MKKLLLTLWLCMLTVAAVFAQEKCNVVYEGEKAMLCTSDYIDTYFIATALKYNFANVNKNASAWNEAKTYFAPYKKHAFLKTLDKFVDKQSRSAHYSVPCAFMAYSFFDDVKSVPSERVFGVFSSKKDLSDFIVELEKFYNDTNAGEFLKKYKEEIGEVVEFFNSDRDFDYDFRTMDAYMGGADNAKYAVFTSYFNNNGCYGSVSTENGTVFHSLTIPYNYYTGNVEVECMIANVLPNFISMKLGSSVEDCAAVIEELAKKQKKIDYAPQWYGNVWWWGIVSANIENAVKAKVYKEGSAEGPFKYNMLKNAKNNGFKNIDRVYNALTVYEENREQYPSIDLYVEELAKALFAK